VYEVAVGQVKQEKQPSAISLQVSMLDAFSANSNGKSLTSQGFS
jgi:hypothetical protein